MLTLGEQVDHAPIELDRDEYSADMRAGNAAADALVVLLIERTKASQPWEGGLGHWVF